VFRAIFFGLELELEDEVFYGIVGPDFSGEHLQFKIYALMLERPYFYSEEYSFEEN
jgi:hypothetical protein